MASIQSRIQEAASQHASIVEGLAETDSAPSQLQQQTSYIADLDAQLAQTKKRVQELTQRTSLELKDHKKYSESTFRRFAHKASGRKERFAEKAAKEEREYFDAIQAQKTAEDELGYINQLKAEAEATRDKYEQDSTRHTYLQHQLDQLFNAIFAGHTPEFPDEDRREEECRTAQNHVHTLNQTIERERQILHLLRQTSSKLTEARRHLDHAHGMSQWDMFGGGTMASMQKRNDLERAESSIQQVRMLQQQLKQVAPHLPSLGELTIAMGSIWGDVVFDNIFTDMDMHDKIKDSEKQVDRAGHRCGEMVREGEQREAQVQSDLDSANRRLGDARAELQRAREAAFTSVLQGQSTAATGDDAPPPAYSVSTS